MSRRFRYPGDESRRSRLERIRWRRPLLSTDEALAVCEAAERQHDGNLRALVGELFAALDEAGFLSRSQR